MRFIVALLIASLFVDKADSELSFIPRHNLYPCGIASTNITKNIVQILLREGFIENVRKHRENNNDFLVLTLRHRRNKKRPYRNILNLKRISRPGLRIYSNYQRISRIIGGIGFVILSTSRGIMADREARLEGIGG